MKPFPEQLASVDTALASPGHRWLFGDEMGVGKTLQAILTAQQLGCDNIVVVGPAMARGTWMREFPKWWPERFEGDEQLCLIDINPTRKSQSKKRAATWEKELNKPVRIVSAELLNVDRERALLDAGKNPCLILDEGHTYASGHAKRSKALRKLTHKYKGAMFATTATPIPNRPINMWNLFDLLWPRRFGRPGKDQKPSYEFAYRYVERIYSEHGSTPGGLSPEHGAELRERLPWMVSRITRQQLAGRMPPCQLRPLTVDNGATDETIRDWALQALSESSHIAVLTHKKQRARALAALLGGAAPEVPVLHIDGAIPTTRRMELLDGIREQKAGIVVATMHSVARSISLSWCARGLLAELYWSPEVLTQVVGRFARLDGVLSTIVDVLVGGGTVQERMAWNVADKLFDNASLLAQGAAEEGLSTVLNNDNDMEQQLLDAAFSVCDEADMEMFAGMEEW